MTRLLAVQISGGFSGEARALALLLRHAAPAGCTARVLCQTAPRGTGAPVQSRPPAGEGSKLFAPAGASAEWTAPALGAGPGEDPALLFAQVAAEPTVGNAVVSLDFGWRAGEAARAPSDRLRDRLRFVSALPRALVIAREAAPDAVYSGQQAWDVYAATYLSRRLRLPQVIRLHHATGNWHRRPLAARLRRAGLVLAAGEWVREQAVRAGASPDAVESVRDPVEVPDVVTDARRKTARRDVCAAYDLPTEVPLVVGLLAPEAAALDPAALAGFADVARRTGAFLILSAGGDGAAAADFVHEAERVGIAANVRTGLTGTGGDELLAAADVALGLSRPAPYGPELLLACAAGLPAVRAAGAGAEEIIVDEKTGLLLEPGDAAGLAAGLSRLIASPESARRMGDNARERMRSLFQPEAAGAAFAAAIGRMVAAGGQR